MDPQTQNAYDLLRDNLNEARIAVRSYDTKAQIIGIGYIFALGVVLRVGEVVHDVVEVNVAYVLIAWGIMILPIVLFGSVLYPSRKRAPAVSDAPTDGLQHVLYVDPDTHTGVDELIMAANRADVARELAFEALTVSGLRSLKRRRFLRALFAAGFSLLFLFLAQLFDAW